AVAEDKSCELECHAMLISYVNNRYLEKVYQQFLDGYVSYVILHLKKDNQESAQLFAELADVIRQGRRDEIGQVMQRYFLSLAEIMRQHMKDWESAEA
ncbi:GntR family transcriptional regulator, partial [Salmonella enterica subsp. enterica serovar Enteritidis]|nr:GntR family transcriptional regulator [Salmonella enterica subsp. enterica serovar Enteritidis]